MSLHKFIDRVSECVKGFKDVRHGTNKSYTMEEIGMAAYSVFHMQAPSFLAHQRNMKKRKGEHNGKTLFGFSNIPSDNQMRKLLDEVPPEAMAPFFAEIINDLDMGEWSVNGRLVIAIDGVTLFSSSTIHCDCCLKKEHKDGRIDYSHAALCPVIVHPTQKQVIPLMPMFIREWDGQEKQDCEINAAKRWIEENRDFLSKYKVIIIADDLFSREPFINLINSISGVDYIFVAKPSSHSYMFEWLNELESEDKTSHVISEKAYASHIYNYTLANAVPLGARESCKVSYFEMKVVNKKGKQLYNNNFVTSLKLTKQNIHTIACIGRNRWRIENEAFNVLKTKGYHLEHNFGHGKKYLANLLATLNIVAFAVHTLWQITHKAFETAFNSFSSRERFFQVLSTLAIFNLFNSWDHFIIFVNEES